MDPSTATVIAAGFGAIATLGVAGIGAWSAWHTSDTRTENDKLRAENEQLRKERDSDDT